MNDVTERPVSVTEYRRNGVSAKNIRALEIRHWKLVSLITNH